MKSYLDHVVEKMHIKLDQFCPETGYMIKFANLPIVWVSKMQTEIALLTTEAEYISLG